MGRIHIISDGTPERTKVYCDEILLPNVVSVTWSVDAYKTGATAVITFEDVAVNVEAVQ